MKKFLLSSSLIISFLLYSLQQRFTHQDNVSVTSPAQPVTNPAPVVTPTASNAMYKDGQYTGDLTDAYYGNIQVRVTISSGKITDVQFLSYPSDRGTSIFINSQAMPLLRQEAITAQSYQVDTVSGASQTSRAFQISLKSALDQAKI